MYVHHCVYVNDTCTVICNVNIHHIIIHVTRVYIYKYMYIYLCILNYQLLLPVDHCADSPYLDRSSTFVENF